MPGAYLSFEETTTSIRVFVAFIAIAAAASLSAAGFSLLGSDVEAHRNALVTFLVLGFATEASYLKLRVGQAQTTSSVSFIPYIASFLLFDTGWAALVAATSMLGVEAFVRRKPPIRIVFNVSQLVVAICSASWMYHVLGGRPSLLLYELEPMAVAIGVLTYFLVNSSAVSVAIALGDGIPLGRAWVRIAGASLLYDMFSSPLAAVLAFFYVESQLVGVLVLILPLYFVRHIYQVNLQLEQVNRDLLELMVKAIEARDPYTSGHSLRVSQMAEVLARDLGLGHKLVEQIRTAALLHDVGKIHEEYAPLLRKEGRLDATERALMQTHSVRSAELVSTISSFKGIITDAVRSHHENYDGSGYPDGTAGKAIPVGSRIIMVADTIDAMTTDRPYRGALGYERVVEELERFAGKQFDPEVVSICLKSTVIREMVEKRVRSQHLPSVAGIPELEIERAPAVRATSRRQRTPTA